MHQSVWVQLRGAGVHDSSVHDSSVGCSEAQGFMDMIYGEEPGIPAFLTGALMSLTGC